MKTRILLSSLLLVVLLSGLVVPAMAQGPAQDAAKPQALSPEEQLKRGLITEKEYDALVQAPGCCGTEDIGGPDPFGYTFIDSDEAGGPAYSWVDISATGTLIAFGYDSYHGPYNLDMTFKFYGVDYAQAWVSSDGWLSFDTASSSDYSNDCPLPSTSGQGALLAPFWDDRGPYSGPYGTGFYQAFAAGTCPYLGYAGACFVVEWLDMPLYGAPSDLQTFEAILFDDKEMLVQVLESGTASGTSATTGIENSAGTIGLTYGCNTAGYLHDTLAILFVPPPPAPILDSSTKEAPASAVVGDPIPYTITILNTGDAPALATTLVDPIPAGTTYNGDVACSSGDCWYDSGVVYWAGEVAGPPKAPEAVRHGTAQPGQPRSGVTASAGGGTPSAPARPEDVLWEQTTGYNQGAVADDFPPEGWGAFSADDFQNAEPWSIENIYVPGWIYYGSMYNAAAFHWCIYPDAGGIPAGHPYSGGEFWCGSAAPTNPAVTVGGTYGGDVTVDVAAAWGAPVVVPAGTWWLVFYAEFANSGNDFYYWFFANSANLSNAQLVDPMDAFGIGATSWTPWATLGVTYWDLAFRLEGTAGVQPPENPVTVTFSVTPQGACGDSVHNEATIADPAAIAPVVVAADTGLVSAIPVLVEGFEGAAFPPTGWTETIVNDPGTDPDWSRVTAGTYPTIAPYAGVAMAKFNSFNAPTGASSRLAMYALDFSGMAQPAVGFYMSHDTSYASNADRLQVQVSTNGVDWLDVGDAVLRYDATYTTPGWGHHEVNLLGYGGEPVVYVGLLAISGYGNNFYVDDVSVGEGCYVPTPDIAVDPTYLEQTLCPNQAAGQELHICNWGDAPLTWTLNEVVPPKRVTAVGDPLFQIDMQTAAGDNQLLGVEYALGYYWVTGGGNNADPNKLYKLDPSGALVATYNQAAACTGWGGRDLAFDGTYLYYGCDNALVYQVDPATGSPTGTTISSPLAPPRALAYDPATDHFWSANWDSVLYEFNRAGAVVHSYPAVGKSTYGMAWDNWAPGGPFLWLWSQDGTPLAQASQVDPATGTLTGLAFQGLWVDPTNSQEVAGGAAISADVIPGSVTFLGMHQTTLDTVVGYDLNFGPPADLPWLTEDPLGGTVPPDQCQTVDVTFDSAGLAPGTYNGALDIHSDDPDTPVVTVPVQLTVEPCGNTLTCGLIQGNAAQDPYGRIVVRWWVEAVDQADTPLGDVLVTADMTWPAGGPVTRTRYTHPNGIARFYWGSRTGGDWTIDVTDMVLAGYAFQDGPNCSASGNW